MKNYSIGKIFPSQCPGVTECADGTWTDRPATAPRLCMRHGGPRFPIPKPEKVKAPKAMRPKTAAPVVAPSAPIAPPAPILEAPPSVVPQTMAKNDPPLSEIRSEDIEKIEAQYHVTQTVKKLIRESFDSGLLKNYTVTSSKRIRLEFQQPKNGVVEVLVSKMETDANNFVNPKKRRYQKVFVYLKKKPEPTPIAPPAPVMSGAIPIDEEIFLSINGASQQDMGEAALHKNKGNNSDKTWSKMVAAQSKKDWILIEKRAALRAIYNKLIAEGYIRKPTRTEYIICGAQGLDELASVQAARSLAAKNGIKWQGEPCVLTLTAAQHEFIKAKTAAAMAAPAPMAPPTPPTPVTSKRLEVLRASLEKKKADFAQRWSAHIEEVKKREGQPIHYYKKSEQAMVKRWDKTFDVLRRNEQEQEKTKNAILKEEQKIRLTAEQKALFPPPIVEFIERGEVTQWRKYPRIMFVPGVDKARIIYDNDKRELSVAFFRDLQQSGDTAAAEKFKAVAKAMNEALKAWVLENPLPKKEKERAQLPKAPTKGEVLTFENINSRMINAIEFAEGSGQAFIDSALIKNFINKKFSYEKKGNENIFEGNGFFNYVFSEPQDGIVYLSRRYKDGESKNIAKIYLKRR